MNLPGLLSQKAVAWSSLQHLPAGAEQMPSVLTVMNLVWNRRWVLFALMFVKKMGLSRQRIWMSLQHARIQKTFSYLDDLGSLRWLRLSVKIADQTGGGNTSRPVIFIERWRCEGELRRHCCWGRIIWGRVARRPRLAPVAPCCGLVRHCGSSPGVGLVCCMPELVGGLCD